MPTQSAKRFESLKRLRAFYNFGGVPYFLSAAWHPVIDLQTLAPNETLYYIEKHHDKDEDDDENKENS